jgi:hypothetical protein
MVPESKGIPRELTVKPLFQQNDMVKGSSNLKINNKIEITTTLAMMKFFDSYCFVMLKKVQ